MNGQDARPDGANGRSVNWAYLVIRSVATSVEVFLHRTDSFGERYVGLQAAAAIVILLLYATASGPDDGDALLVLTGLYATLCLCIKAQIEKRKARGGVQPHSLYNGRPLLLRSHDPRREASFKATVEPLLVWFVAAATIDFSAALGTYLFLAGGCLLISASAARAIERKRALDMHDAVIEQRSVMERFRDPRGR